MPPVPSIFSPPTGTYQHRTRHEASFLQARSRVSYAVTQILRRLAPPAALLILIGACGSDRTPVTPTNRPPIIRSVSAQPETLALSDSTTITCDAIDPDGDSLRYDWFTQVPLRIVGAPQGVYLYNSRSQTQILYYSGPESLTSLARVQVFARDTRGLQDGIEFFLILR